MAKKDALLKIDYRQNSGTTTIISSGGGSSVDTSLFLLRDGTQEMLANLDMGGFSVTNVNLLDGVDVGVLSTAFTSHVSNVNAHHNQVHTLDGSDHTGNLAWARVTKTGSNLSDIVTRNHSSLQGITANDHHQQIHTITGSDHIASGSTFDLIGLTATNTLGILTPSQDVSSGIERILKSSSSGNLILASLTTALVNGVNTVISPTQNLTLSPGNELTLNPGNGLVKMGSGDAIQGSSYASRTTGWRITDNGEADFRYLFTDELHAKTFIADLEQALAGGQIIAKSVAVLASDFVIPGAGLSANLVLNDLPSAPNMAVFESGDFIGLRKFSRSAGSLTIGWAWGTVTNYIDGNGVQTWTFTRSATPGSATGTIAKDSLAIDFGTTGNGFYEVNAIDGAYGINSPYAQIVTWNTHPSTQTVRTRFGNLRGITNVTGEFGLFAGNGTSATSRYFRASSSVVELRNVPLALFDGTNNTVLLSAGSNNNTPFFAMGATLPTAPLVNNGIWMGLSGGAYHFRVGSVSGGALTQGIHWDGNNLTVSGTIVVTGSFSGVNYAGAATPGGAANSITGQGALATLNQAAWSNQVSGRPIELTDGRIATAISNSGVIQSRVDPSVAWGANPGAGLAGLLLGSDYMGYWTGSAWRSYLDNQGRFYLNAGAGSNFLSWNGTTLTINGAIVVQAGSSGIGTFSDAGALATADNLDGVPDGASYKRTTTNEKTGAGRAYAALDAAGALLTRVDPATAWGANPGAGLSGLLLGSDYMGYWDGSTWRTYLDNSGRFYFRSSSGARLVWDGTRLFGGTSDTFNSSTAQWYVDSTDGKLVAGQGAVMLSSTGISVASSASTLIQRNGYRLLSSDLSRVLGGIYGYMGSNTDRLEMNVYSTTGRHAGIHTVVDAPATQTADWILVVSNDSYTYGLTVSTQFGLWLTGNTYVEGRFEATGVLGYDWSALTPDAGWTNYDAANYPSFGVKRFGDLVSIKGVITATVAKGAYAQLYQLVAEYRPARRRLFTCWSSAGITRVDVAADGRIYIERAIPLNGTVSLEITYFTGG